MISGAGKPAEWTEQSRIVVQTVTKTTKTVTEQYTDGAPPLGDASRVAAAGDGLQSAAVNQETVFTIDGSRAGKMILVSFVFIIA